MKLCYRGNSYEYEPGKAVQPFQPVAQSGSAYNLIYRGTTYRVDPQNKSAAVSLSATTYKLIYRGITYLVNRKKLGEASLMPQSTNVLDIEPKYV